MAGPPTPEEADPPRGGSGGRLEVTASDGDGPAERQARDCVFYFDLASPYAYLAAERVSGLFAEAGLEQPEWQPVLLGGLFKRFDRSSWARGPDREAGMRDIEQKAAERGLAPIHWPDPWPGNSLRAMRAALFAKRAGRVASFSLAAFRQAFAAGRDLSEPDNIWIAGAACELHPRALAAGVETRSIKQGLIDATAEAGNLGVTGIPSLRVGDEVFWGDDRLEDAVAAALAARTQ